MPDQVRPNMNADAAESAALPVTPRRKPRFRERHAAEQVERPQPLVAPSPPPQVSEPKPRVSRAAWRTPAITLEQSAYVALVLFAFVVRFWADGSRAMHGDEAVHAWLAWNLYSGTGYHYDPVYHGPLQFIVTAGLFFLFGVSNLTARLMAILFGSALVGLLYLVRPYVGRTAALIAAFFVAVSPAFVYVSRLERDDIFTSFFALLLGLSIFSLVRTGKLRYLYLGAAAAALSLSAMENTYITLFVFGTFVLLTFLGEWAGSRPSGHLLRALSASGPEDCIRWPVLAGFAAPLLLAFAITIFTGLYAPVPVVAALGLTALVVRQSALGAAHQGRTPFLDAVRAIPRSAWINALAIVVAVLVLTFSTFGSNLHGIWDASQPFFNVGGKACVGNAFPLNPCRKDIIGGLFYWLSQHEVHRGGQPWYYYSLLYGLYEQIGVFLGLAGVIMVLRRPSQFTTFLVYWGVLMFGIYSWAGEKFSWLMIHPLLPFLVLAALVVVRILSLATRARYAALVAVAALLLVQLHNAFEVNFVHAADPVEMMVYVQSAPDTPIVAQQILALSNKVTNGRTMPVTIDTADTWPFAWYLRDMPNVAYPAASQLAQKPFMSNPVQIIDESDDAQVAHALAHNYTAQRLRLRWWFPEDYKTWSWSVFGSKLVNPSSWSAILQWQTVRHEFGPKQAVWFYYYVKHGLASPL